MAQIGHNPQDWDKNFKLMANVDMSDYDGIGGHESFEIIGYLQWEPYESKPFTGVFDGNGKRITNLNILRSGKDFVGHVEFQDRPRFESGGSRPGA